MAVEITGSSHCCGIYQMRGVQHTNPWGVNLEQLVDKTKYVGRASRIIQFSATPGGFGDVWRDYIISKGYQCDKFDLGLNPKTNNRLFLYHWYTHKAGGFKARKLSVTREYRYEEKQERKASSSKSGGAAGAGTKRDSSGRFVRRI